MIETIRQWPESIVYVENYDMGVARNLTRGCDVWLNTPRRPLEASGTSGMKAAMNGVLNLSVLDGWWPEGCEHGVTGWAIGAGDEGPDQDERDLRSLYGTLDALLPREVIIASSSSGLTMSEIQAACPAHPERCVIGHPFNPPHLIPLVEIVGGAKTSEDTIRRVTGFYTMLGKRTIRLHKEVPGHVANRLQAALWREVVHLVDIPQHLQDGAYAGLPIHR